MKTVKRNYQYLREKINELIFLKKIKDVEDLARQYQSSKGLESRYSGNLNSFLSGSKKLSGDFAMWFSEKYGFDLEMIKTDGEIPESDKKTTKGYVKQNENYILASEASSIEETGDRIRTKGGNELMQLADGRFKMEIKMVDEYAHGGYLTGFMDQEFIESLPSHTIIVDEIKRGFYRAFRVIGESMSYDGRKSIDEGDIVTGRNINRAFWKSKLHYKKWDAFVIVTKERILIKKIIAHDVERGIITCQSNNTDKEKYPDFNISLDDVQEIFNVTKVEKDWQ